MERRAREPAVVRLRWLTVALATALLGLPWLIAVAPAQDFPSRIVRIVVAFPAGGPTDFVARLLADKLKSLLGQSVVIENKPGANGAIGAEYVARGEADGHLLFLTTVGAVAVTPHLAAKVPYDPIKDFAPVTLVVRNTTILVVKPETPVNSAKELAALARDKPGAVPFASTGTGSMTHLALELYQSAAGVKFLHVPYRGAAPALTDLLGGQVQAMFADAPVLLSHIKAGALKPLGAASETRNGALPEVPTLAEQGFADTVADNWYGLLAPAKTPPAVIAKLHDAVVAAIEAPEVRDKLVQSGAVPTPMLSAVFAAFLAEELARWGRVVREKNIKAD
jgi:tripartite-type tricarboxylate transporter receptor subunit TctC